MPAGVLALLAPRGPFQWALPFGPLRRQNEALARDPGAPGCRVHERPGYAREGSVTSASRFQAQNKEWPSGCRSSFGASWDRSAASIMSPFLAAGAVGLYVKYVELNQIGGFLVASRFLGRVGVEDLTLAERLSFFREDLLLFVAMPLASFVLLACLPRRWRGVAAAAGAGTLCVIHAACLLMLENVGQFLSLDMVADALRWARDDPAIVPDYLQRGFLWKFSGLLAAVTALAWIASGNRVQPPVAWFRRLLGGTVLFCLPAAAFGTAAGFLVKIPSMAYHRSGMRQALASLLSSEEFSTTPGPAEPAELLRITQQLTRTEVQAPDGRFWGTERGKNVLFFVFETGPVSSLDFTRDAQGMPGAGKLVGRAFVSRHHYTTYPYTSDAIFSMLTGLYPLGRREFLRIADSSRTLGVMNVLRRHGYRCLVYSPVHDTFEADTRMFDLLGATERIIAPSADTGAASARARLRTAALLAGPPALATTLAASERLTLERRLTSDFATLERMKDDLARLTHHRVPFVAAFLPQIGHGPWVDLRGNPSVLARGRELMLLQDAWLEEIVSVLRDSGALEQTVIVVTADHGLRTRAEYPDLPAGEVNEYSFNVPLLVYAPGSLRRTVELQGRTSHVDIAPTILALLGIRDTEEYAQQGLPLWEAERSSRRLFFFARDYFGADGYADGPDYFMWQPIVGAVWQSTDLDFGRHGKLVTDTVAAGRIIGPLREMYGIQPLVLRSLVVSSPRRSP